MKRSWSAGICQAVVFLFFMAMTSLHGCGGGGGGGGSVLSTAPISITGPDGSVLTTPEGGHEGVNSVSLSRVTADSSMAPTGETPVSDILEITTAADYAYWGDGHYTLAIPVDTSQVTDTAQLQLNVRLRNGIVIPVYGQFDSESGSFVVYLSGIVNGWRLAVTENPNFEILRFSKPSSKGWLTDLSWETYEWEVVNHSDMTPAEIEETIMPSLWGASQTLAEAGFRSPRIYIDPRLNTPARVVHIIKGTGQGSTGSHFSSGALTYVDGTLTYADEDTTFSTESLSDDELTALGAMYINYEQYESLHALYGVSLGNIVSHELFHAVQYGYDIRKSGVTKTVTQGNDTATVFEGSLKAYLEGTATPLGQTFQLTGDGSITGPSIAVRSLRDNEHARLYQAVDSPEYAFYYTKQDFFAYVAKRYNSNSWVYTEQLFEYMSIETANQFNKTVPEYLGLYRSAMDKCFTELFGKRLTEIYTTYARDRAYEHSDDALLRPGTDTQENGFGRNTFYWPLFQWSDDDEKGVKEIDSQGATFDIIPPLSTVSAWAILPDPSPNSDGLTLTFTLTGGSVTTGTTPGVRIKAYLEGNDMIMIDNGSFEITDISKPVIIPLTDSPAYLTLLISNAYVENRDVTLTITSGPYIASISPDNPLPGDDITLTGSGFGDSQATSTVSIGGDDIGSFVSGSDGSWSDSQIRLTLPDGTESGPVTVTVNGATSNEALLMIGTPSPNWEMTLNIDTTGSDPNDWGNGGMPMSWRFLEIYKIQIPVSVAENGVFVFRHDWTESDGSPWGTVSHHVEGTGTFNGRDLFVTGTWTSNVSDNDPSDNVTYSQTDSGSFTGTGTYRSSIDYYSSDDFNATYSSTTTLTRYDGSGEITEVETPSCTGTIPYFQLAEIEEFIKTTP